jgi:CheY-like chemotaxis protein
MIAPSVTSSLRALVVEDSVVNQKLLAHILTRQGFDVTVADNGQDGVEKFDQDSFDVVLMDVQMPVMDGLTATRIIRHHESGLGKQHTPIIAVTAGMDRESCLQAGMDDHLYKPVRLDDLRPLLEPLMMRASMSSALTKP